MGVWVLVNEELVVVVGFGVKVVAGLVWVVVWWWVVDYGASWCR